MRAHAAFLGDDALDLLVVEVEHVGRRQLPRREDVGPSRRLALSDLATFDVAQQAGRDVAEIARTPTQQVALDQREDAVVLGEDALHGFAGREALVDDLGLDLGDEHRVAEIRQVRVENAQLGFAERARLLLLDLLHLQPALLERGAETVQFDLHLVGGDPRPSALALKASQEDLADRDSR